MTERLDPETLKKLRPEPTTPSSEPENGAKSPSPERLREAVREANDPKRLGSMSPEYRTGR